MIDTITLRLDESQFRIFDHDKFSPSTYHFFNSPYTRMGSKVWLSANQNPTKKESLEGIYKPQLTLSKIFHENKPRIFLYIQFSAPKILFGNNFDELKDSDLDEIILKLSSALLSMGVSLRMNEFENAKVTKIHYSKNIVLPEYTIPHMVISEVRKVDLNMHHDLTEKDYRNGGHSIRFHTNEFELIIYDKKKDLQKSKKSDKKSIEKDNAIQLNLFDTLKKKKPFEVLRIEARLNSSNKIKSELGISKEQHTLYKLFNSKTSVTLLSNYWKNIIKCYQIMSYEIENKEKFLANFMINNPEAKLTNALTVYSIIEFSKEMGIRKFRNLVEKKYTRRTWYGLKKSINKYNINGKLPNHFDAITKTLDTYQPLRLEDYKDMFESL